MTAAFADEVWRHANALAWRFNWRGHARAVERLREAEAAGHVDEVRLWRAVEARLRPR